MLSRAVAHAAMRGGMLLRNSARQGGMQGCRAQLRRAPERVPARPGPGSGRCPSIPRRAWGPGARSMRSWARSDRWPRILRRSWAGRPQGVIPRRGGRRAAHRRTYAVQPGLHRDRACGEPVACMSSRHRIGQFLTPPGRRGARHEANEARGIGARCVDRARRCSLRFTVRRGRNERTLAWTRKPLLCGKTCSTWCSTGGRTRSPARTATIDP
jgi:hypothetical protein